MNKRRLFFVSRFFPRSLVSAYVLCAVLFILGVFAGSLLSAGFADSGAAGDILGVLLPFLTAAPDMSAFNWFLLLLRFPVIAFLLGFSALGAVGIPLLCFARGFSLAFSLSVLVRLYAGNGALIGLILFGAVSASAVPVFLMVASGAFSSSVRLGRAFFGFSAPPDPDGGVGTCFLRFFAALLFLLLLAMIERAVLNSGLLSFPIFS